MKINYCDLIVGHIMVSDTYSVNDSFGDYVRPSNTGHIDHDGKYELMINLGKTYGGEIYVPVKWVNGEHNLSVITSAVKNFIERDDAVLPDKFKDQILRPVTHGVGQKYVSGCKQLYPKKQGQLYFRDVKKLRDAIKQEAYKRGAIKSNNTSGVIESGS